MAFFVIVLLIICSAGAKCAPAGKFNTDYITKDATTPIKGIFVALILFSHGKGYIELGGVYDKPYTALQGHLGQMVVAMFLFYSGFGIMEQIKKKGYGYIKTIPVKRFPSVLLNLIIAVLIYLALAFAYGQTYSIGHILLSFIGWESVGNSNWYIFVILALYVITFVAFYLIKWFNNKISNFVYLVIMTVFSVAFVVFEYKMGKDSWYYNTVMIYPFGMWYSYFKDIIDKIVMKNNVFYLICAAVLACAYIKLYNNSSSSLIIYTLWSFIFYILWSFAFVLAVVMFTMKVKIENPVLNWLGNHVFSVYIIQRVPMIIFAHMGVNDRHKYEFMIASIICAVALAEIFDRFTSFIAKKIWGREKKPKKV